MSAEPFSLREARWPHDKEAALRFINALQAVEHAYEPDRRLDEGVAEEYLAALMKSVAERNGRVLFAEDEAGAAVGWAVAFENENEVYVVPEHRTYGYISELYVVEEARGQGIGRALIAACETWARERGRAVIMIGTLSGNRSAFETYRRSGYAPYATFLKKLLK